MSAVTKLQLVKTLHTIIWLCFVGAIGYVWWSAVTGYTGLYAWVAAGAVAGEGIVLLLFGGRCPLTAVARKYSDSMKSNFDIYLPEWLAKHNKAVFTSIYLAGLLLLVWQYIR